MNIERPNPKPEKQPYAILHMQHASYFAYEEAEGYSVYDEDGNNMLQGDSESYNDVATVFVENAADI